MAIHLHTGKDNTALKKTACKIQSLPCKIYTDEDANVSNYFEPYVRTNNNNNTLTATFRGYPLKGRQINLPENYIGIVVEETTRPQTDKEDRKLYVTNNFKSIIHWNWDKIPSRNDRIAQALDWIDIAEALHSPIVEE